MVEFRWAALIAVWSLLVGPVLDLTSPGATKAQTRSANVRLGPPR